jgi:NAD(P)-dependent dehydrogenase (short-subunit alcohol dehydrogenase family)
VGLGLSFAIHRKMGGSRIDERINLIPLKRGGQALDVARVAVFLASDSGNYITGETIAVSGGD